MATIFDITPFLFFLGSLWSARAGYSQYAIVLICLTMIMNLATAIISIYEEPNLWSWARLGLSLLITLALGICYLRIADEVGAALPSPPYGVPGTNNEQERK